MSKTKTIWRLLEPGEITRQGDQIWSPEKGWREISGRFTAAHDDYPFRRKIEIPAPHPFDEWLEDVGLTGDEPVCKAAWNACIDIIVNTGLLNDSKRFYDAREALKELRK